MSWVHCIVYVFCVLPAMALNSKFHDTLYRGVTWTSSVTLVRLPWNIPLLTNWLEVLLIRIYKVQYVYLLLWSNIAERTWVPLLKNGKQTIGAPIKVICYFQCDLMLTIVRECLWPIVKTALLCSHLKMSHMGKYNKLPDPNYGSKINGN